MLVVRRCTKPVRVEMQRPDAGSAGAVDVGLDAIADMNGSLSRRAHLREGKSEDPRVGLGEPDHRRIEHRGDPRASPRPTWQMQSRRRLCSTVPLEFETTATSTPRLQIACRPDRAPGRTRDQALLVASIAASSCFAASSAALGRTPAART